MFPISDQLEIVLFGSILFIGSAAMFSMRRRILWLVPLVVILVIAIALFAPNTGVQYEGLIDMIQIAGCCIVVAAAAIWTWIASKIPLPAILKRTFLRERWGRILIIVAPALAVSAIAAERQYVPEGCTTAGMTLHMGERQFNAPIELRPTIFPNYPSLKQRFHYTKDGDDKESLHDLCRLTNNGRSVISANLVSMGTSLASDVEIDRICASETRDRHPICVGHKPGMYPNSLSVMLTEDPQRHFKFEYERFSKQGDPEITKGGTLENGYVCNSGRHPDNCVAWRQLTGGVTIVGRHSLVSTMTPAEKLLVIEAAMDHTLAVLTR